MNIPAMRRGCMRFFFMFLVYFSTFALSSVFAQSATFQNPLFDSGPDPWMTWYNGNYYFAATTWGNESTGLTMRKAPTIAALKAAAPVRIWQDSTPSRSSNYWAPEFFLLDGPNGPRWYGYFTGGASGTNYTVTQHIHVIESAGTDPMGPYTYKGQLVNRAALDGSILQFNGSLYSIYGVWDGTQNIYIVAMKDPWTITGEAVMIVKPTYEWETSGGTVTEGPVALRHDGRTFIIYSASACWGPNYALGMLTLTGPDPMQAESWTKNPTPVFQRSNDNKVFGPGHNTFFTSPDGKEDWIVYHANRSFSGGCDMFRSPRIQKFAWNPDGTPSFGVPVSAKTELAVPSGEPAGIPPER